MGKILLAEDDPFLASLLKTRLEKESFEVRIVKDGEEALKTLRAENFDLLLLDIILPKKSGFELIEEIRLDPRLQKTSIMIISNLGQPEDVARGQKSGVIEYFIKAKTSIDDLASKIKQAIESKT